MKKIRFALFGFATLLLATSCKEILEKDLTKVSVKMVSPIDGVVSDSATQAFYWEPIDSNISYELQVVSPRFDSAVRLVVDTNIKINVLQLTLPAAQYQWRVRAYNSSSTTQFTTPWNLTIQ